MAKLNVGCGHNILEGWANLDIVDGPGVDIVWDMNTRMDSNSTHADAFDEILMMHVIEHLTDPLAAMESLWHWAQNDCRLIIRCPYGTSDDADEDPTHVRRMFPGSFGYFGQPYYWRADYGYRGDWRTESVTLYTVNASINMHAVNTFRNTVREMVVIMRAVKPRREPLRELQVYVPPTLIYTP